MAKFLYSKRVEQLEIHGGSIPLNMIKLENITLLNLSSLGLYSEDLFILSQFLRYNHSITHINLQDNNIGYTYLTPQEISRLRDQNSDKV